MKISERTIKRLGEIITGDKALSPYRSGPKLVSFFNDFGTNHTYGDGFPSRWKFAEDCLRQFNATPGLKKIILSALDPRDFMGATVYDKESQQNKPANVQDALTYLNEVLAYDGYEVVPHGKDPQVAASMLQVDDGRGQHENAEIGCSREGRRYLSSGTDRCGVRIRGCLFEDLSVGFVCFSFARDIVNFRTV